MKILIVSDTHGREQNLDRVLEEVGKFDFFIHLGDVEDGEDYIRAVIGNVPLAMVAGNNDFFTDLSGEAVFSLGNYRVMVTHGHYYYVSRGHDYLAKAAREKGADIVMYGHTHRPCLKQREGLTILNPGSLSLPRQKGYQPTWVIMEIDGDGQAHYAFYCLNKGCVERFLEPLEK